jgi:hypothetical protein
MRITRKFLLENDVPTPALELFSKQWPTGVSPSFVNLWKAYREGFSTRIFWLVHLLPMEGLGSQREFAFRCAEQGKNWCPFPDQTTALNLIGDILKHKINYPEQVANEDLVGARSRLAHFIKESGSEVWRLVLGAYFNALQVPPACITGSFIASSSNIQEAIRIVYGDLLVRGDEDCFAKENSLDAIIIEQLETLSEFLLLV